MAYYAAVSSLKQTIERLLNSSQISILPHSRYIIESAYQKIDHLQVFIEPESYKNSFSSVLEGQIREAACKLEDALEFHVSNQFLSQSESFGDESFSLSLDLKELNQDIKSFMETHERIKESDVTLSEEDEEEDDASSRHDNGGNKTKMVGFSDQFSRLKDGLIGRWYPLKITTLVGMAGIGKSTLAKELYEDEEIKNHFECRAWVKIGPKYKSKEILLSLLAQMDHDIDEIQMDRDWTLIGHVQKSLSGKRYLVVLDDIWNVDDLVEFEKWLPNDNNGSRVLSTTRLQEVDGLKFIGTLPNECYAVHQMCFLNKEESWNLLREIVFEYEEHLYISPQLEKVGKKIAKKCDGLPLTIVTVAKILSREEKTLEYWNKVVENKNSVFLDAYDEISKVLYPSYKYLPQYLKPCFLYMGAFPLGCKIPASKLIHLWIAEGFLEPNMIGILNLNPFEIPSILIEFSKSCLGELVSRTVVLALKESSIYGTKTCRLHSAFWHLCKRIAAKEKFMQVISSTCIEGIENQRRLCIHNNVLFGLEEVRDLMESISMVRSLLCTGPNHKYPVPICFGLRLLRVMDALTIRFYKFPIEVLKLVQLRYLALTCNGKIPSSISKLWNLVYFIVHRHMSINRFSKDRSYLPVEIWNMQELRHLQVIGSNLPDPCGAILPNLLTLLDVSAQSCTKEVLERIPNLQKLGIQIELAPDANEPLMCFDHLSLLHRLRSLKCVVVNPYPRSQVVPSLTTFPSSLEKLSLSGFGYPWKYMRAIAQLPMLKVLKLRQYAFRGPKWVVHHGEFIGLKYLMIEDTDLVCWEVDDFNFSPIDCLIIRHCYKLKKIPTGIIPYEFKVVDCPLAMASAEQTSKERPYSEVRVHSSWEDGKLKC